MKVFDEDPNIRWAFCMTHPDDEISICAWIRRLVLNGNPVFLSWSHDTQVREAEGRAVAKRLGVPEEHLRFLGASDQAVCDEIPRLLEDYGSWFEFAKPDRVCCGAFEQGHIDHDATNFVVNSVFQGPVLEIPFYHAYHSRIQTINRFAHPEGEEILGLTPEEIAFKKEIAKAFPSQNIWSVLLWYEIWQAGRFRPVELAKSERMRLQTHRDFTRPNLPEALARRVEQSELWRRWLAAVEPHIQQLPTDGASMPVPS